MAGAYRGIDALFDYFGRELDVEMTEAFTFADDGRVTEFWALATDQPAVDAFWA